MKRSNWNNQIKPIVRCVIDLLMYLRWGTYVEASHFVEADRITANFEKTFKFEDESPSYVPR